MFCPPFATSLPQSEYKVASTQSKGLVKHGWKAHGGQEKVEQSSFNEKQESNKQSQKVTPNLCCKASKSAKVDSTQSKGLVKDGWKAHGGQERVERHSFNEKHE